MTAGRPGPVLRRLLRAPTLVFRAGLGPVLGERFLMLTHVGRRSGRTYRTVLEVVARLPASDEFVVVAGSGASADWLRNARAGGAREVSTGRRRFRPVLRLLPEDEAADVLGGYERRNPLITPLVRHVLSRLVGWRYTGSTDDRRRLVGRLPVVAFAPAEGRIGHPGWVTTPEEDGTATGRPPSGGTDPAGDAPGPPAPCDTDGHGATWCASSS